MMALPVGRDKLGVADFRGTLGRPAPSHRQRQQDHYKKGLIQEDGELAEYNYNLARSMFRAFRFLFPLAFAMRASSAPTS
jgi:hypothetical protein